MIRRVDADVPQVHSQCIPHTAIAHQFVCKDQLAEAFSLENDLENECVLLGDRGNVKCSLVLLEQFNRIRRAK